MKLSRMEFLAMNNPVRRLSQRRIEFKVFQDFLSRHSIDLKGKTLLDLGCGSGYSTELLERTFEPVRMSAIDLMPEQIERAKRRKLRARFQIGDAGRLPYAANSFDAVFCFGVLHHVPKWRHALEEVARVLKPHGVFLVEELSKSLVDWEGLVGFKHPEESRFEWWEFEDGLKHAGLGVVDWKRLGLDSIRSYLCQKQIT
jgi:ubiquinone/menaquinone biosynthesis C-methylase UbiE